MTILSVWFYILLIFSVDIVYVQVLHNLSVWTAATKSLTYDEAKSSAKSSKKEFKMVEIYTRYEMSVRLSFIYL